MAATNFVQVRNRARAEHGDDPFVRIDFATRRCVHRLGPLAGMSLRDVDVEHRLVDALVPEPGLEPHQGTSAMRCDVSFNFLGSLELAATEEYVVNPASIETMHGAASHRLELTAQISRGRLHLVIDRDPAVVNEAQHALLCDAIRRALDGLREEWS